MTASDIDDDLIGRVDGVCNDLAENAVRWFQLGVLLVERFVVLCSCLLVWCGQLEEEEEEEMIERERHHFD